MQLFRSEGSGQGVLREQFSYLRNSVVVTFYPLYSV
jgi:hypothetical protein